MKAQLIAEHPDHYQLADKSGTFKAPKRGLSEELHAKIKAMAPKMADGGETDALPERKDEGGKAYEIADLANAPNDVWKQAQELKNREGRAIHAPSWDEIGEGLKATGKAATEGIARSIIPGATLADEALTNVGGAVNSYQNMGATAEKQKALGITPQSSSGVSSGDLVAPAPTTLPEIAAPPAAGTPNVANTTPRGPGEFGQAISAEQKAIEEQGRVKEWQARQEADVLAARNQQLQKHAIDDTAMRQKGIQDAQAKQSAIDAAREDYKRIDATVDPGRYWASRSTGGKIAGIIGLALGALGAGNDGVNKAAGMMNQAIDRDLDAQKAEHEMRLRKGQQSVDQAQSAYANAHQIYGDKVAASDAAKGTLYELAKNSVDQIGATAGSPIAREQAKQFSAVLGQKKAEFDAAAQRAAAENGYKNQMLELEKSKVELERDKVNKTGGASPAEIKELHDSTAAAATALDLISSIKNTLGQTKSNLGTFGIGVPLPVGAVKTYINQNTGEGGAKLNTDVQSLIIQLKNIDKLGQIGPADSDILKKTIGDPQGFLTREDTKQAQLSALEGVLRRSIANQGAAVQGARLQ